MEKYLSEEYAFVRGDFRGAFILYTRGPVFILVKNKYEMNRINARKVYHKDYNNL